MSDPRDRNDSPPVDSDTFQEWVSYTADERGIDEDELLNQLLSAFWVLDEMNGLMIDGDGPGPAGGSPLGSVPGSQQLDELTTSSEDAPAETFEDDQSGRAAEHDVSERDDAADAERDVSGRDVSERDDVADAKRDDESEREAIRDMRDSLQTQLELVRAVGDLREQVTDLSLDVERQRSRREEFTNRISDELTRLHSRVETVESAESGHPDAELLDRLERIESELSEIDARHEDVDAAIEELESTHREFETWVDAEFDGIEGLFERVLGTTDELEERLEAVETELTALAEPDDEPDRLARLRREALRSGVDGGRCETCDASITLSLLDEPICPSCDAEFSGVERGGPSWNPFSSPTIRTESTPSDRP